MYKNNQINMLSPTRHPFSDAFSLPSLSVDPPPLNLEELFAGNSGLPEHSLVMHMSPDGTVWWIGGREGPLVEVSGMGIGFLLRNKCVWFVS